MNRRSIVGMVLLAGMGLGLAGCQTQTRKANPYINEMGVEVSIDQVPKEVADFIRTSNPDAQVEHIYEMRHRKDYRLRHFEIHLLLPGGRKKVYEYNVFIHSTVGAQQLDAQEVPGNGTSPGAQPRGEMEGKNK